MIAQNGHPRYTVDVQAVHRAIREDLTNEYRAGRTSRFRRTLSGVSSMGSGADYHYASEPQFLYAQEVAWDYFRNDPIVGQGVRRVVANVVQKGFQLDVDTGSKALDAKWTDSWNQWANDADASHSEQEHEFAGIGERLTFQSVVVGGDVFALPLKNGGVQYVESYRCRTPNRSQRSNVVHGVAMNSDAIRTGYVFTKESLNPRTPVKWNETNTVPARDNFGRRQVFQVYDPDRFSQRRGVPMLNPIADEAGIFGDLNFATLVAAQMQSCFVILEEMEAQGGNIPGNPRRRGTNAGKTGDQQSTTSSAGFTKILEEIAPGVRYTGREGYKVKGFSPTIPAPPFFQHAMLILSIIAVNLDLPVAVLMLDPTKTNFSGWRGAIDQARQRFQVMQDYLIRKFHRRVFRWKVDQWLALDEKAAKEAEKRKVDPYGHVWNPPQWGYIEPVKDVTADLLEWSGGANDFGSIQRKRGRDPDKVLAAKVKWNGAHIRQAKAEAKSINEAHDDGQPVSWRDVMQMQLPQGVSMQLDTIVATDEQNEPVPGEPTPQPAGASNASDD